MRVIVILATLLCAASLAAQADARPRHPMPPAFTASWPKVRFNST